MENIVDIQKICLYCVNKKPLGDFVKGRKVCKICYKEYMKQYYKERKENIIGKQKNYYSENKEKLKSYSKSYYQKNKEKIKERYYQNKKKE